MKKLYTILTSFNILVLVVHMIYMTLTLLHIIQPNEDFAQNMGYTLMYSAILHGMIGLLKMARSLILQRRLPRAAKRVELCHEAKKTWLQRILGVVILIIIIPHVFIKIESAGLVPLIGDLCYMIALFIHLSIGFPKWIVSLGIRPIRWNRQTLAADGGNQKWK